MQHLLLIEVRFADSLYLWASVTTNMESHIRKTYPLKQLLLIMMAWSNRELVLSMIRFT